MKYTNLMNCQKCGKEIELKGNRKYCKTCKIAIIKENDKKRRDDNPEKTKEIKRRDYLKHIDRVRDYSKIYYQRSKEKYGDRLSEIKSEQFRFGNNRIKVLERDNYKCVKCGSINLICVHHIDGSGRGSKNHNNNLDNLITLCRTCHIEIHRK